MTVDEKGASYQLRVHKWVVACFGEAIAQDRVERNYRLLEEALELVQSLGLSPAEAHQLVDWVYAGQPGEPGKEVGDVMNTIAALCTAHDLDMEKCADDTMARCWANIEKTRAKNKAKPRFTGYEAGPVVARHREGCDYTHSPVRLCDCPLYAAPPPPQVTIDEETIARVIYQSMGFSYDARTIGARGPYGAWAEAISHARAVLALVHPAIERARVEEREPAAWIQREVLDALAKDKTATATVASGLLKRPFGNAVPLYAAIRKT